MRNKLISSFAGAAFSFGASGFAIAADMAVKAPPPPPQPVFNWTGFYVGGNLGVSAGRAKTDFNAAPVTVDTTSGPISLPGFGGSNIVYPFGFIGGGQIGYNWQFSPILVVGLEADFQGADEKEGALLTNALSVPIANIALTGTAITQYEAKISWFGTVRPRIGYLWGDGAVMSYVTGGLAYGKVDLEGTSTVSGALATPTNSFSITHDIGHSNVNTGWVAGYGIEGKLLIPGWTYRIESLYMDLGTLDDTDSVAKVTGASGGQINTHTRFTDTLLRVGLNYQFH